MARYFEAYAAKIMAPIRSGVDGDLGQPLVGAAGFRVVTSQGEIEARRVVAATGPFQRPLIPLWCPTGVFAAAFRRLSQPGPVAPGRGAGGGRRLVRGADRG